MSFQPTKQDFARSAEAVLNVSTSHKSLRSFLKRSVDIVLSAAALIFTLPLLFVIAVMIKLHDGGSPFFIQRRIGTHGEEFNCIKFRSMVLDSKERLEALLASDPKARREWMETQKLENDPRITRLGAFLRKSSLDELPQLWNILLGEMSIVGPRPIVKNEIEKYGPYFDYYADVRPGLTGLWQVSGRSDTTYDERVELDVTYVKQWSFMNDMKIILQTVPAILMSKGAR